MEGKTQNTPAELAAEALRDKHNAGATVVLIVSREGKFSSGVTLPLTPEHFRAVAIGLRAIAEGLERDAQRISGGGESC